MNFGSVITPVGGHLSDTSLSSAETLTRPSGADVLMIQAFTQAVRYTLDGSTPSTTNGFRLAANEYREIPVGLATAVKVIEEAASASIQYHWGAIIPAQR